MSHLHILPFLRSGNAPTEYMKRIRTWHQHPKRYGFFPYFFQAAGSARYKTCLEQILPNATVDDLTQWMIMFIKEIDAIFDDAPPLVRDLVVYRGVKENYWVGKQWDNSAFVSATLHPLHAFRYKNPLQSCCVQRIIVPKGTRVLFLEGISSFKKEWEILLPRGGRFSITDETDIQIPTATEWKKAIPKRFETVHVQDVRFTI